MSEWLRTGTMAGIIAFVSVIVFCICCLVALILVWLFGKIAKHFDIDWDKWEDENT